MDGLNWKTLMKKEFKVVDEKHGIVRITTDDERFYFKPGLNKDTGVPEYIPYPSTSWVCNTGYPKSKFLQQWREDVGSAEADRRKKEGGTRGSKVHYACEELDKGIDIDIRTSKYLNPNNDQLEELTADEIKMVLNWKQFRQDTNSVVLASEIVCFSDITGGTIDRIMAIPNSVMPSIRQIWVIDIKTSSGISREYELQASDYSHMDTYLLPNGEFGSYKDLGITDEEWVNRKIGIVRLNYGKNGEYKLDEINDCYDFFRNSVYPTWKDICGSVKPKQYELPLVISLKNQAVQDVVVKTSKTIKKAK